MSKARKLRPGAAAPNGWALNVDGQKVSLSEYWKDGPILLTFLRHFG